MNTDAFNWLVAHGYPLMFVLMLVEGPVITAAGAFAAKLGYFRLSIVFSISIAGNLLPDILYYALGYWGRAKFVDRFGKYFKLDRGKIIKLESLMRDHAGKTLLVVKLLPFMAVPGLMVAGLTRMPLRKYITLSLAIILPTSLLFLLIGYYTGEAYDGLVARINNALYLLAGVMVVFIIISYTWKKASAKIARKIEKL